MAFALPLVVSYASRTVNADGTISMTAVLKDNNGVVLAQKDNIFSASTKPFAVIKWLQEIVVQYVNENFSVADIPASAAIQFGLPATVRPIDLL